MKSLHFYVSGRVQGVFYRHNIIKKARALGLKGFVRNTDEGRVEVLAEGEEKKVDELLAFCKNNPGHSNVKDIEMIEEKEISSPELRDFNIKQ